MLSVVVRFQSSEKLSLLKDALFSLAYQGMRDLQIILVANGLSKKTEKEILAFLSKLPLAEKKIKLANKIPKGVTQAHIFISLPKFTRDTRAANLNLGIKCAGGRFIAFLDYDDVIYPNAYQILIEMLRRGRVAIAVGGTLRAVQKVIGGVCHTRHKEPFIFREVELHELLVQNLFPLHSYVIDLSKVPKRNLYVDERLSAYEDYYLLLRVAFKYSVDLSNLKTFICEYRMRDDYSNHSSARRLDRKKQNSWVRSKAHIDRYKLKVFKEGG